MQDHGIQTPKVLGTILLEQETVEKLLADNNTTTRAHEQRIITPWFSHNSCYKSIKGYTTGVSNRTAALSSLLWIKKGHYYLTQKVIPLLRRSLLFECRSYNLSNFRILSAFSNLRSVIFILVACLSRQDNILRCNFLLL